MQHLQPNATLQGGKYRIERVLGQGGSGIAYLAEQVSLGRKVAVKEFFMKDLCKRGDDTRTVETPSTGSSNQVELYRKKFIKEARNLARLNHPHIINVIDVFEENDTVYYVMPYLSGGTLQNYVERYGILSEKEAMRYVKQIASALKYMHEEQQICHYDVKPSNILLDGKGNAVLIDFGISKNYDARGHETSSTPVGLSEGYAPIEQYQQNVEEFSPASDVYALGATLYFLLHGKRPVSAVRRVNGALFMRKSLSQDAKDIITASMKITLAERANSVDVFLKSRRINWKVIAEFASVALVTIIIFTLLLSRYWNNNKVENVPNPEEIVDLGLPSGTIWGTRNVGEEKADDNGLYYTWGGVDPVKKQPSPSNIDMRNISGTSYDVASVSLGKGWHIPNISQFRELIYNCKWEKMDTGYIVKGPNGNTMFLPFAGCILENSIQYQGEFGYYWTSESLERDGADGATELLIGGPYPARFESGKRNVGRSIRPVYTKTKLN